MSAQPQPRGQSMRMKVLTGVVTIPFVLLLIYIGGWPMFLTTTCAMLVGLQEFYSAVVRKNIVPSALAGWVCSVGIMAATQFASDSPALRSGLITTCLAGSVLLAFIAQLRRAVNPTVIANAGATVLGVVWVGLLFSFLLRLRMVDLSVLEGGLACSFRDRAGALVLVITAIWTQDTFAQLTGRHFGTKKPWPHISPNKTWEGCAGGLLAGIIMTLALGTLFGLDPVHMILLGLVMGVFGQLGDFCKSLVKRELKLKDFGKVLPGHGGILDRFDSLLFSMPIAYLYFRWFVVEGGL